MACSGISVDSECEEAHEKQVRHGKKFQWIVYKIGGPKEDGDHQQEQQMFKGGKEKGKGDRVRVDYCKSRVLNADHVAHMPEDEVKKEMLKLWTELIAELPCNEPRYAVFDFVCKGGGQASAFADKLRFIAWCPETCTVKNKMVYSSTKDTLKKKLHLTKETFISSKNTDEVESAFSDMWLTA